MTNKVAAAASSFLSRTNELGTLQQSCIRILSFCESNSSRIGLHIHCPVIKFGLLNNLDLCNNLLSLYLKTDSIWNARKLFDEMPQRTVFAWTVMISAYTKSKEFVSAVSLFGEMMASGTHPSEFTFSSVIRSCAGLRDLSHGARVHGSVIKTGFLGNSVIGSSLTDLYSKCGKLKEARELFSSLQNADTISWTMMISSLVEARKWREALQLYFDMIKVGVSPNEFTFVKLLGASSFLGLEFGKMIHSNIIVRGVPLNVVLKTSLIDFYSRFSLMEDSLRVLNSTGEQDVFLWTSVVSGFVRNLRAKEAIGTFLQMRDLGLQPNNFTYSAILSLCSSIRSLELGKQIHSQMIKVGLEGNTDVGNALVDMYMKCSASEVEALGVFAAMISPNVISWTTLILGLVDHGFEQDCFGLLMEMVAQGVEPNGVTLSGVLRACSKLKSIRQVLEIHGYLLRRHVDGEIIIGNSLVDAYASLNKVDYAWKATRLMDRRDDITYTSLVTRFNELGKYEMALSVISHMFADGIRMDPVSLTGFISASANLGALLNGKHLHCYSEKSGFSSSVSVSNSLVDMYGKCGLLEDAKKVFEEIAMPDVVSWNGMVSALASNGCISSALSAFEDMRMKGFEPDSVTFVILLSACSNGRLTEMGLEYFQSMKDTYNIEPQIEHYVHLVGILGRAGRLEEATGVLETMQLKPNAMIFKTLLRASRYHGNLSLGEDMANKGLALAPSDPAFYILLADLYEESGKPELAQKTRNLMSEKGLGKKPSQSSVEVQGKVHSFVSEDVTTMVKTSGIYAEIESIKEEIKRFGSSYRGNENASFHSAKQAVVYGFIYASPQAPVHVVKNKILCKDCHDFVSILTRLVDKKITVRDGNQVHIFKNGKCSCKREETTYVFSYEAFNKNDKTLL
ncbi:PREDICTED: pentatricopeptide repeat-containing protein At5g52850, chloroplastic-like [Camelina sativa]|uniref:Pentatricopeptide repeat-containing protein At5g52850, chloroplastic-like n=1 Tax=Camelina sativa TaxID=90675 RepID=A0ABM0XF89_CAMSA|nr:PREDICTED: pentatricopeptide repeat-containing protein At5g52850, chloroplastic-like [Camelina sativa]